jgi:8-amino-7-oxononanoate synthase
MKLSDPSVYELAPHLQKLKDDTLYRTLKIFDSSPSAHVSVGGKTMINFASNNYLGLATDERLKEAATLAIDRWGVGATASRLLGGTLGIHDELEKAIALFKNAEACAVFPSGYHANLGVLPVLMGSDDTVILDRASHASLVDGARLSKAKMQVFGHNDLNDLEHVLRRAPVEGKRWIVTESVFSMDGDVAPLCEMVFLAGRYNARLYVDEAHATGVFGPEGRGVVNGLGLEKKIDVVMGTLSKALGSLGGYVCGQKELVEWIHNRCRSFIYSTALAPASAAAALVALEICRSEPHRRERLEFLSGRLRRGLAMGVGKGPIVPFILGEESRALALSRFLGEEGIFAPAVRPPTVPLGTARLRFSVTAEHSQEDIDKVLECVKSWQQNP